MNAYCPNYLKMQSCGDPACPICGPDSKLPVKLSPKPDVTHGWDGLDDEAFTFFGVLRDGVIDEYKETATYRGSDD